MARDRPRRGGRACRHQAHAGGQALSRACACSLASSRRDVSSRVKPSTKAGPKVWGLKDACSPGPRRHGRPGTGGGPGPSHGSRGSGMAGGRANGRAGASGSLGAATAPGPDSSRSWRRHLARRFWNHTWRQREGCSQLRACGRASRLPPFHHALARPPDLAGFCPLWNLTACCSAHVFCYLPHGDGYLEGKTDACLMVPTKQPPGLF